MYVADLADACLFVVGHYESEEINYVGWGQDTSIREPAELARTIVAFTGLLGVSSASPSVWAASLHM